jgi:hypothetical protein
MRQRNVIVAAEGESSGVVAELCVVGWPPSCGGDPWILLHWHGGRDVLLRNLEVGPFVAPHGRRKALLDADTLGGARRVKVVLIVGAPEPINLA